jgi:hypothetical protein
MLGCVYVFNATFKNISVISCQSVLLMEETGNRSICDRGRMVVGFTTTCAISVYHHLSCEFEPRSWPYIKRMTMLGCVYVFNATFKNSSVISCQSVLLVEETGNRSTR